MATRKCAVSECMNEGTEIIAHINGIDVYVCEGHYAEIINSTPVTFSLRGGSEDEKDRGSCNRTAK